MDNNHTDELGSYEQAVLVPTGNQPPKAEAYGFPDLKLGP
jgi:hypothetical protein